MVRMKGMLRLLAAAWLAATGLLLVSGGSPQPALASGGVPIIRTIDVAGDAMLNNSSTPTRNENYGGSTFLRVQSKDDHHSVLRFDLSSVVPNGSTVSSATLYLYYYAMSAGKDPVGRTYYADRLTQTDWVEGTAAGATQSGSVCWNYRQYDTLAWTTVGGTYTSTDEASSTVPASFGWMSWTVTNQVQTAVTDGLAAHFVLRDPGTDATNYYADFYSRNYGSNIPYLSITYTAPWDSYQDSERNTVRDTFNDTYYTVYMKGTGFASGTYNVAYYDAGASGGQKVTTETNITVNGSGVLNSQCILSNYPSSIAGTWHALAQPTGGTAFPSDYNTAVGAPGTYNLVANDSFTVQSSAIPEFPTMIAGIFVVGACSGIYYWMRKRRLANIRG